MMVCNSLALKLAKITRGTPDPPGGVIVRDASGEPTGVLKDAAMDAIAAVRPPRTPAELAEALRAAHEGGGPGRRHLGAGPSGRPGRPRRLGKAPRRAGS